MLTDAGAVNPPPDEALKASEPYRSNSGRALTLTISLMAYAGVTLLSIVFSVLRTYLPVGAVIFSDGEGTLTYNDLLVGLTVLLKFAAYVATAVLFCVWVHRAYKNLKALGNPDKLLNYSPGWAVGSFFIPLASLVLPYIIVKEIWDRSDPNVRTQDDLQFQPTGGSPLLLGWWIVWIVSNVLTNMAYGMMDENAPPDAQHIVTNVSIITDFANLAAAALAVLVVQAITRRQEERSRHVVYTPEMPPPPPIFHPHAPQQPSEP